MKLLASGAIGITVKCAAKTKTFLPDILDLKGKVIKFIDVCNGITTTDTDGNSIANTVTDLYFNLMQDKTTDLFIKNAPLRKYSFNERMGKRDSILRVVDFPNSYIENKGTTAKNVVVVFWFDDSEVSNVYNDNDKYNIDSVDVVPFYNEKMILFKENRTLYNKQVRSISTCYPGNVNSFVTADGNTSYLNDMYTSYLTLQKNNYQFLRNVPVLLLCNYSNANDRIYLHNVTFDYTNSFVRSYTSNSGAIMFNIEYK